jgi:Ca2+-binding RTX toxin-like protein
MYISIEGIVGSNFDDHLTGDSGNNFFRGGNGADVFDGGSDTVEYLNSTVGITASLADPSQNTGEAAGDTYISIENLTGSNNNDTLYGDDNDIIAGKAGADNLHGGNGSDTADYVSASLAVVVDFVNAGNNTNDAAGDTYDSIENIRGSQSDDTLLGDANANVINGSGGNDIIDGRGGLDVLIGGAGNDTFVFSSGLANGGTVQDFNGNGASVGGLARVPWRCLVYSGAIYGGRHVL